jgi:hypothetical protein
MCSKYLRFFRQKDIQIMRTFGSFHIFLWMSYSVDKPWGKTKTTPN